jgi:hypothetical protein
MTRRMNLRKKSVNQLTFLLVNLLGMKLKDTEKSFWLNIKKLLLPPKLLNSRRSLELKFLVLLNSLLI